ncbi:MULTISPECIES: dihydrofolate reductase family protein [unclassified Sporosarcina]|uniref:dihydrofolate reductase family protein n=1 Tax=unclassified Sporosarcina TaxID=2647733 RepID=UPI0020401E4C|nr:MULTISPECIES: dihydrofolate reductase family protein [unclassified Sporosarcina]GKV64345.1 dihydrofolate reductase [Sporosarcina sp. NCCP-2331]GLB55090.1 dihydrofolate reductase [Sporosarcina sp. NCCP-2378]
MKKQRKLVLFIAQSLDGYIATKDDSLDWLFKVEGEGDNGYSKFFKTVDTVLMGKRTYDWVMEQEKGQFPYSNKDSYVFSRSSITNTKDVTFVNGDIVDFTNNLKKEDGKDIWIVGGGDILYTFIKEKLVDDLIVTVAPIIIGEGIPLFKAGDYQLDLSLRGTRTFNQFVELHYTVNK